MQNEVEYGLRQAMFHLKNAQQDASSMQGMEGIATFERIAMVINDLNYVLKTLDTEQNEVISQYIAEGGVL